MEKTKPRTMRSGGYILLGNENESTGRKKYRAEDTLEVLAVTPIFLLIQS